MHDWYIVCLHLHLGNRRCNCSTCTILLKEEKLAYRISILSIHLGVSRKKIISQECNMNNLQHYTCCCRKKAPLSHTICNITAKHILSCPFLLTLARASFRCLPNSVWLICRVFDWRDKTHLEMMPVRLYFLALHKEKHFLPRTLHQREWCKTLP